VLRPPGALPEERFADLCIRCGSCIRACPTGCLPASWDARDPLAFQTPAMDYRRAGCAFDCKACGRVCPTGAIRDLPLAGKQRTVVGTARIDPSRCIPHRDGKACVVCYSACPVAGAVALAPAGRTLPWGDPLLLPAVDPARCIGCGLCEAACPVPGSAVRVGAAAPRGTLEAGQPGAAAGGGAVTSSSLRAAGTPAGGPAARSRPPERR